MYILYGNHGSGSAAVEAALLECGAAFELRTVTTSAGEHRTDEFARLNPRRQIPVLVLPDGSVMSEGAAMMLHLADAHPQSGLAPAPGSAARAQHDRWLVFMAVNLYEGELRHFYPDRYTTDPGGADGVEAAAIAYLREQYAILDSVIGEGPFLFGANPTMADFYLWTLASWTDRAWLSAHCPKVARLAATIAARPKIAPIDRLHNPG